MGAPGPNGRYVSVADIEVDVVVPTASGFRLQGKAADGADYQVELHLDLPVDQRTQRVLAELLSQSELKISRRTGDGSLSALRRERARQRK
jgi:hypothetical protein